MTLEPGTANGHRLTVITRATVLFGQLRKRNRRRILLDPASKVFNPGVRCHAIMVP